MENRLILIDGISGSGKSTTAQFISHQLNLNGFSSEWYHEEEDNHPLWYNWQSNEATHSIDEVKKFIKVYPTIFKEFANSIKEDNKIHIIESYYLQDSVRILFQNNIDRNEIYNFYHEINKIIELLNPLIIYFQHGDVLKSINKTWEIRGEYWKNWFIENISNPCTYVKSKKLNGEVGAYTLMNDYQNLTNELLGSTEFPVITLDSDNSWISNYELLLKELNIKNLDFNNTVDFSEYIGEYQEITDNEDPLICKIYTRNNRFYTNICMWESQLIPNENHEFKVQSFPISIIFQENEGNIDSFIVKGKDIYGLNNLLFIKK